MRRIMCFLCAATLSVVARAQSPSDPLEACVQKAESAARLACFDQQMQRRHTNSPPPDTPIKEAAAKPHVQLPERSHEQGIVKESQKPIVARVVRSMSRPDHRYTILLDNGQVWEQVDGRQGLYVDAQETVTISSAALGSFVLETSKRQYLRVRRLQ